MLRQLSFDEFTSLSTENSRVAVFRQLVADQITPISVYQALAKPGSPSALLESAEDRAGQGRYSFIAFDPKLIFEATDHAITISDSHQTVKSVGDPFSILRELSRGRRVAASNHLPPLVGGAIGYCGYDAVRLLEKVPDRHQGSDQLADMRFCFYDSLVVFDHLHQVITLIRVQEVEQPLKECFAHAMQALELLVQTLRNPALAGSLSCSPRIEPPELDLCDEAFKERVMQAKEYIAAGDVFQVVLSRTFTLPCPVEGLTVFRALRMVSPAPYLFFLQYPDFAVAGASPERLVSVKERAVEANPIAGTRPRVPGAEEELLAAGKDRAEHMMLVDLARNDVGSVSVPGSVDVRQLASIQRLSHVVHMTSSVCGRLSDSLDAIDALQATFPAGTVSGAPKIRAMEIIDELETSRRGFYGGAVCYLDNRGNLDSCLAIRCAVLRDGQAIVRTGAGIVHDSDPQSEADETRHKAASVLEAIRFAQENFTC